MKTPNNLPESYFGFIYHYYRAEIYRETNWRNRLDATTNWSIVVSAGIISLSFSNENISHLAIIINYLIIWFFLYIESRRFRYYSVLRGRTRILEKFILAPLFSKGQVSIDPKDALLKLHQSLTTPKVKISRLESVAWRIRRIYMFLFPIIFLAWAAKVSISPVKADNLNDFFQNAGIFIIPGIVVFSMFFISVVLAVVLALYLVPVSHHNDLP